MGTGPQARAQRRRARRQKICFALGNLGQSAFYNAMSTFFMTYVTTALFVRVDKGVAARMIALITSLVVVIRIAEIFLDPIIGNIVDNTRTKWGRFRVWQFIGGIVPSVLLVVVFSGLFGLVNVNTTWFITLFIITFITLDVFYSARDISYWGMIPALSSNSHERAVYTSLGSLTGSIGYNGVTVIVIPIVSYFTYRFTGEHVQGQSGWTAFAVIIAVLGLLTAWSVAFGTRESSSNLRTKEEHCGPLDAFKAIGRNDQLLWTALSYLLYAVANVATTGVLFVSYPHLKLPTI
ncbi:MAG: MFS transporter, partial [Bifidobacterium castoris]|nr:MFS transporter [Bifidobacterium castoris]